VPIELAAHTEAGGRLLTAAERLAETLAAHAPQHDRDGSFPFEAIEALKAARYFAAPAPPGSDRFAGVTWTPGRGGAPLLTDALASLECTIAGEHPGGDHWIVVRRVDELHLAPAKDPLIFFEGGFHGLFACGTEVAQSRPSGNGRP
jgi:alkylation response protein AidB-like acyl-CoA dehydrogenase